MREQSLVSVGVSRPNCVLYLAVFIQLVLITPCAGYSANSAAAKISNELGIQVYEQLSREQNNNVLFSPLGLTLALGAVRLGARGIAAKDIDKVANWSPRIIHRQLKSLRSHVTVRRIDDVRLEIRNVLLGYRILGLRAKYRKLIRYYGAKTMLLTSTELLEYFNKRARVDLWQKPVKRDPQTFFVSDVKLDAVWEIPFSVFTKSSFYIPRRAGIPDKVIQAEYMGFMSDEHKLNYFDDKENSCQVIEMNYGKPGRQGDMWDSFYKPADISMVIVLPYKNHPLKTLEKRMTVDTVHSWLSRMKPTNIDVSIPKFNLSRFINAAQLFNEMGVQNLKHSMADVPSNQLMVRSVWQEANLAATGSGTNSDDSPDVLSIILLSKPKKTFHAKRPFVFLVRDKVTDTILFIGRVSNPNVNN